MENMTLILLQAFSGLLSAISLFLLARVFNALDSLRDELHSVALKVAVLEERKRVDFYDAA